MTKLRSEKGFTLVELAVVMIIIGLLIGGVLKGQELIKSAKVTSTISQVKAIDAATSTFQDIYSALPGDLLNPATRLPGCTTDPCIGSAALAAGDGIVAATAAATPFINSDASESRAFFVQLAAADLLSGVAGGTEAFSGNYPQAPVGGGWLASSVTASGNLPGTLSAAGKVADFRAGLYLMHQQLPNDETTQASNSLTMDRMDRKIDDGNPLSGSVYAAEQADGECINFDSTGGVSINTYDTAQSGLFCNALVRIQN